VEGNPIPVRGDELADRGAVGSPQRLRPPAPARAVTLAQGGKGRPGAKGPRPVASARRSAARGQGAPDELQRLELQRLHALAVDSTLRVERATRRRQPGQRLRNQLGAIQRLDAKVQEVQEASGAGVVRARLRIGRGIRRVQRVGEQERPTVRAAPFRQLSQASQVADLPALRRARGIQLHRPSPAEASRRVRLPRRDQQQLAAVVAFEPVVTVRQVARQAIDAAQRRPVLEHQRRRRAHRLGSPPHQADRRWCAGLAGRIGIQAHGPHHRIAVRSWNAPPDAEGVDVLGLDQVRRVHERGSLSSTVERPASR
jgi:hypothetical protein